jgi:hypothetical protein
MIGSNPINADSEGSPCRLLADFVAEVGEEIAGLPWVQSVLPLAPIGAAAVTL